MTSHLHRTASATSLALALAFGACQPQSDASAPPAEAAPSEAGQGLVILPYEDPTIGPTVDADPRLFYHDFGRVLRGEVVARTFRLRNTDSAPLTIKRLVPSCGCTLPSIHYVRDDGEVVAGSLKPKGGESVITIPAGVIADLTLSIDTRLIKNANVDKLLTATITTDSPNGYYLSLEAHIFVERPFTLVPGVLNLGRIPVNAGGQKSIQIVQSKGFLRRVTEILETPARMRAELTHDDSLGQSVWTLNAILEPPLDLGRRTAVIVLGTETEDGEPSDPIRVTITADGVPDLMPDPSRMVFSADRATATEASGGLRSLLAGHRFLIQEARVTAEHAEFLSVTFEPVEPDGEGRSGAWRLLLETRPPLPADELIDGQIELTLDDPQHPQTSVPYVIHLR
jgi:hypothetical protein